MTLPIANLAAPISVTMTDNVFGLTSISVTPTGELKVANPPVQLFNDTFDSGTLDTTNRWTTPTNGGTGIIASNAVGQTVLNGGTTANSFSKLPTQFTFAPSEPGYLFFTARINIESPVLATGYRFWGFGTSIASPTIANPITQGVGFEISTAGKLFAVTYATGARNFVADLSSSGNNSQPKDSAAHKYFVYFKGDQCYWSIDTQENVVANFQTGASGPDINGLPLLFEVVSNAGAAETLVINGVTVRDTAHTTFTQADGQYSWRRQKIGANGEFYAKNCQAPYPSAPTNVTSANADTALSAANANRRQLIISNDSTAKLYVLVDQSGAGAASATNFTYVVPAGATFEMPNPVSTARIRGFWSAANGSAAVTDVSGGTVQGSA